MSLSGEDAAARAHAARERAAELEERLARLRAGEPVTPDDVEHAEQAAARQQERSAEAHRHAARAHQEAARRHRQASEVLEPAGHPAEAEEHRRRAVVDDQAARADLERMTHGTPGTEADEPRGRT